MLGSILNKSTCAECRICCSFVESDAWETPIFTNNDFDYNEEWFNMYGERSHTLSFSFKHDREIKLCPYLHEKTGCSLKDKDKPFDCKKWPLRLMRKEGEIVIALSPICKGLGVKDIPKIKELLNNGLRESIMTHAGESDLIKDYREDWIVL